MGGGPSRYPGPKDPWTWEQKKQGAKMKHGGGTRGYIFDLNRVYTFIYQNHGRGGTFTYLHRTFTITPVDRSDDTYEYDVSILGGSSDRTLIVDGNLQVMDYCRRKEPEPVTCDEGNTGGASSNQ